MSEELGDAKADLGTKKSLVGFAIRLESCMGSWSRLIYATTVSSVIDFITLENADGVKGYCDENAGKITRTRRCYPSSFG